MTTSDAFANLLHSRDTHAEETGVMWKNGAADLGVGVNTNPVRYCSYGVLCPGGVQIPQLGQPTPCWLVTLPIQSMLPHILPAEGKLQQSAGIFVLYAGLA